MTDGLTVAGSVVYMSVVFAAQESAAHHCAGSSLIVTQAELFLSEAQGPIGSV